MGLLFAACHDDPADAEGGRQKNQKTETYKVAVILPGSQQERWERTAEWALENLALAQDTLKRKIVLELEWYDEDKTEGLADFISRVDADPSYKAIIGPSRTENAYTAATICSNHQKTLILPQCTSAEMQRLFAEAPNVFHLTQSDIGQIEILLTCALSRQAKSLSLLVNYGDATSAESDYCYGSTFRDWLGFLAYEAGLVVDTVCTYTNDASMKEAIDGITQLYASTDYDNTNSVLIFVPNTPEELVTYDSLATTISGETGSGRNYPYTLCSDASVGDVVEKHLLMREYEGIDIAPAAISGFVPAYQARFSHDDTPIGCEPQLFDALHMLTFALTINPNDVNNSIVSMVNMQGTSIFSWLPNDLTLFLNVMQNGVLFLPCGVLGDWQFDSRYHASIMNTTYSHWKLSKGKYITIEYISLEDTRRTVSNQQLWQLNAHVEEHFDPKQTDMSYVEKKDNYAVVVSASTGWRNYRHQADALDIYKMLRNYGYKDDHIILILEGDIVNDCNNKYPGEVRVSPDGENLFVNINTDYKPSAMRQEDLLNILTGKVTERTPTVLNSTDSDNVFVFWSGHGQEGALYFDRDYIYDQQIRQMLEAMHQQGKYRKLFFVTEACYSGSIARKCEGIPSVLFLTAANASETSKSDVMDPNMHIWLSNVFTRAFCTAVEKNPAINMRNLYYQVAQQTVGSHATMYNYQHFGNMFTNSFSEFLP